MSLRSERDETSVVRTPVWMLGDRSSPTKDRSHGLSAYQADVVTLVVAVAGAPATATATAGQQFGGDAHTATVGAILVQ